MKKKVFIFVTLILILFMSLSAYRVISKKSSIEKALTHHLSLKGYASSAYNIKISFHFDNALLGYDPYAIKVIFTDEPNTIYLYDYNSKEQEVVQRGISKMKISTEEKDFKHNE